MFRFTFVLALAVAPAARADTLRVPQDHKTVQAALDAARPGDTVLVAAGTYRERVKVPAGVTLRSAGTNDKGKVGLKRAEATVLDGGGAGKVPGVELAEGAALDGFTVTNVGTYDEAVWKKHFDSRGEELGDDEGASGAEGSVPAVRAATNCTVSHCVVHHNGDVGISVAGKPGATVAPVIHSNVATRNMGGGIGVAMGAEPVVRGNTCTENLRAGIGIRAAHPVVTGNTCTGNVRAGIGVREGSKPVLRGNTCTGNRRAGIGIRMEGTAPVVERNECAENGMAGIGTRDGAEPVLRNNVCRKNALAGIGARDGAKPLIVGNECRANGAAGIGLESKAVAVIHKNVCADNALVAIGVTGGATATVSENDLSRTGGQPPLVAVRGGSTATVRDNKLSGGGVAAVLVEGTATVTGNTFTGAGAKQGTAVWVWEGSTAVVSRNSFDGYRTAVSATKATVTVTDNTVARFGTAAIVVRASAKPAHVFGNTATSADPKAVAADVQGSAGVVEGNTVKKE